jgi:hypothetical protein
VTNENILKINWSLGNTCNLDCSYCPADLKDGSTAFPTIEVLRPAFAHLLEQARAFSLIQIDISSGEPTACEALKVLMLENTSPEIKFKLQSNGQADIDWWKQVAPKIYAIDLSYHSHTDLDHFINVVNTVKETSEITIRVPHTDDNWIACHRAYLLFKEIGFPVSMQMLYKNFTKGNNQYLDYDKGQWDTYYRSIGIDPDAPAQVSNTVEYKRMNNLNNYYGHLCYAGVNQIIVDSFGYVYRGWCKSNGHMGNIFDSTFRLDPKPRPCPRFQCSNGFDLMAPKSEKSWGMA